MPEAGGGLSTGPAPVLLLEEAELRALLGPREALAAVKDAFVRLARGQATLPDVIGFELPGRAGEVHVKGAYLHGQPYYCIKEASGFYANATSGLPVSSGVMLAFRADTGFLAAILRDNGYLTELRTGAAGALAADLLARAEIRRVGVLGAGVQARYQLEALLQVRRPARVVVWSRSPDRSAAYAREAAARCGVGVDVVSEARHAVRGSDLVVTATPARRPILEDDWVEPGTHVTAVGSDGPGKQELPVSLLARAAVFADSLEQCLRLGEIHHAVAAGLLKREDVRGELGQVAAGDRPGRRGDDEVTIADLTGVGVQDAAVANAAVVQALERGAGRRL